MSLESLLTLVEKLRKRIDVHGHALRQNEALTRYTLIDPLLRELGWDTEDPALVIPEYTGLGGSADYALFNGDKPLMIVEAKKLDTSLRDGKVLNQGLNYCQQEGTPYLAVTDGRRWDIYETHKLASIDEKRIVQFDLKGQSAAGACLKALTLWGLRVSGQVTNGPATVVEPPHNQPDSPESRTPNTPTTLSPYEKTAEQDADEKTLVENLQREDISPLERATAYQRMMECYGYDEKTLAKRLGIKQSWRIQERLSLLKLRPKYQQLLRAKQLTRSQAYEMSQLEPRNQDVLFHSISTGKLTTYKALRAAATALVKQE